MMIKEIRRGSDVYLISEQHMGIQVIIFEAIS